MLNETDGVTVRYIFFFLASDVDERSAVLIANRASFA